MRKVHSFITNFGRIKIENYFVYITTNSKRTTFYIGVTNDLRRRIEEHTNNAGNPSSFAGKYYCNKLIYWERFDKMIYAIEREKQIKKWSRIKKLDLISEFNPEWKNLNGDLEY